MFPQTLTGIQLNFSGAQRKRAIGLYAIAMSAGAVTGQILGTALVSADLAGTQWRSIFLINVPIGITGIAAAVRHLPADTPGVSRRIDLAGVAMLSVSVLLVVLPLTLGVAALGTLYLSQAQAGAAHATHAFALTTTAFAAIALFATAMAHQATRPFDVMPK